MQQYKYTSTSYWGWGDTDADKTYLEINAPVSVDSIVQRLPTLRAIRFKFNANKLRKENNHVAYLKEVLEKTRVEHIVITGSEQLTELPSEILRHPLIKIQISQCPNLNNLAVLGQMMELQHADFSGEQITLPKGFFKLPILEELIIVAAKVDNFNALPNLSQLKSLSLRNLTIDKLPAGIEKMDNLQSIQISNLPNLEEFPSFRNWKQLTQLFLNMLPQISELPDEFTHLVNLNKLGLNQLGTTGNSFKLPNSIGNIPTLKDLNLSNLPISNLIDFTPKNSINTLTIRTLPIRTLPKSFSNLTQVSTLTVDYCQDLEDVSNIRYLKELRQLRLESLPEITQLNFDFYEFPKLESLNLDRLTNLVKLPEFGIENTVLKQLWLKQLSALTVLPDSISECTNLVNLSLNQTNIKTVPKSFNQLQNLEVFELVNAPNFDYFPSELFPIASKRLQVYAPHILDGSKLDIPKMVKHIRENLPKELHQTLAFWLFNNFEKEPLTAEMKQQTLEALSEVSPDMRILLLKNLYRLNPNATALAQQPRKKGDKITINGSTQNKRTLLRQQMEEMGFVYVTKLKSDVRFVLLAKKPKIPTDFWASERVVFSETEFMNFQKTENPGFLQEDDTPPEFIDNLRRLLWSVDPANEKIALEMVRNNGLPEELQMDFLVVAKTSKDKTVRNDARKFLKGNLDESGLKILNDRTVLTKKFPPFYALVKYAPEPTIALIAGALYKRFGIFLPNFFQYDNGHCTYRKEMLDALFPTFLERPKYVSFSYNLLEKEVDELLANPVFEGQLNRLVLGSKLFKIIPAGIFKHQSIKILQLVVNEASKKTLPSQIGDLFKLTNLDLRWLNLESLPPEIGKLTRLKSLTIWTNQAIKLPEEFINLKKLTSLRISLSDADRKLWQEKMPWCTF